jgi:hypothetical protein
MKTFNQQEFVEMLQQTDIKPRLKRDLKFVTSTAHLPQSWADYEILSITDRTGDKGVLLLQPENVLFIAQYELSRSVVDSQTGRGRAIICDFCYTWQPGPTAASITFTHSKTKNKIRFLCCSDLECSQHVRTKTKASIMSRAQLRESLSNEDRVARLKTKLQTLIEHLGIETVK